jgi:hypothetical protein
MYVYYYYKIVCMYIIIILLLYYYYIIIIILLYIIIMFNIISKGYNISNKNNSWVLVPFSCNNLLKIIPKKDGYLYFNISTEGYIGDIIITTDVNKNDDNENDNDDNDNDNNNNIIVDGISKNICIKCKCNNAIKIIPTIINIKSKINLNNINIYENKQENKQITFIIVTSRWGLKIAESLSLMLKSLGYETTIIDDVIYLDMINKNNSRPNEYFIILFSHLLKNLPSSNKYIMYQLEQKMQSRFITNNVLNNILNSLFTIDYSLENINNFQEPYKSKLSYYPMPIINSLEENNITYDYDLLFFGSVFFSRRTNIIKELEKKYNIYHTSTNFGEELYKIIKKSKIIINLHVYPESILETARINEVLPFNKLIISELPCDTDNINKEFYEDKVVFCPRINDDLSNISNLYEHIDKYLNMENYNEYIKRNQSSISNIYVNSKNKLVEILLRYNLFFG